MKKILDVLKNRILISDGAWGTLLQERGLTPGECPELWNIDKPDEILAIAQSYVDAGADMIETNSFGANAFKLAPYHLESKSEELNRTASQISRKAAGCDKFVLGCMGPTGKMLLMGDVTEAEMYDAYRDQAVGLAAGGADALVIETMSDIEESKIAIRACKENTECEVICTMTFEKSDENSFHTMMGITPQQMTQELIQAGADIVGANCGNGMENMIGIVRQIRAVNKSIPILIQANAGAPIYKDGKTVFPESAEQMAALVPELIKAGVNIIGGCCGTTPYHIQIMADKARSIAATL